MSIKTRIGRLEKLINTGEDKLPGLFIQQPEGDFLTPEGHRYSQAELNELLAKYPARGGLIINLGALLEDE